MNRTIIVCYTFPPNPGIGGRRWAKFAKYLHRNGAELRIIAAKKKPSVLSSWNKDISELKGLIDYLPSGYPHILTTVPNSFWQRWKYRIALLWLIVAKPFGNYFDHSINFGKVAAKAVEKYIQLGYNNVIVSCGPFRMAHKILALKSKYPGVQFILDFRDPWANNNTSFGFQSISEKRRNYEYKLEADTVSNADCILAVSDEMLNYLKSKSSNNKQKYMTLDNGYDKEDFDASVQSMESKKEGINLLFTGTLYNKTEHIFQAFCDALRKYGKENGTMFKNLKVEFYGSVPHWFHKHIYDLQDIVQFKGNLALQDVYLKIAHSSACMVFLTDDLNYSRSTKFYEYTAFSKPIVVFSTEGETGKFVTSNSLGFQCRLENMEGDLYYMLNRLNSPTFAMGNNFDNSAFDVKVLSQKIQGELI